MFAALLPTPTLPPPRAVASPQLRTPNVQAKFVGAALAAAFASKNEESAGDVPPAELSIAEKEDRVIEAIRAGLEAGITKPKAAFSAIGDFGIASGDLAQTWLTPQQLENCAAFWGGGSALVARDLRKGRLDLEDLKASPWFLLLALNTFPWTPLLVPLVGRAVNSTEGTTFLPRSFRANRLSALRRTRRDGGIDLSDPDTRTPQNIDEGVSFFRDGSAMLARDVRRGRLFAYGDTVSSYGWFTFLAFSTFPLTPLLIPLIDKRRDGKQADYVPAAFRARRLATFERYRALQAAPPRSAVETVRAVAAPMAERPSPAEVLSAIVDLTPSAEDRATYLDRLAGGGSPGRRWTLAYTAGSGAVKAARQQRRKKAGGSGGWLKAALLPWTRLENGLYVDGFVTAIQRFDASTGENENGIFGVLGATWLRLTVTGPFRWPDPERRTVCAFQPTIARCALGPLEREFSMEAPDAPDFKSTAVTKLPFFKFVLVDDLVAVAQGRSGGVAVWVRDSAMD